MKPARIVPALLALTLAAAPVPALAGRLSILSVNCSPREAGQAYDGQNPSALQPDRLKRIAAQVAEIGADVVLFQGLWKDKQAMAEQLWTRYGHALASGQTDGLLILTRSAPWSFRSMTFGTETRDGPDASLEKGALLAGLYDPEGGTVVVVDTQLQSGSDRKAQQVRETQAGKLAWWIYDMGKSVWRIGHSGCIIAGDFNEPISWQQATGRLFDHSRYLVSNMASWYLPVDNRQSLAGLYRDHGIKEVVEVDRRRPKDTAVRLPGSDQAVAAPHFAEDPLVRNPEAAPPGGWSYLPEATDPGGGRILDQVLLSGNCRLVSCKALRRQFLGDRSPARPFDPGAALTRRAAVLAVVELPR
jgi:hypothetical protein